MHDFVKKFKRLSMRLKGKEPGIMKAKIREKNAVLRQKISQSQPASKMLPNVTRLPTWEAPLFVNRNRIERT